MFFRCTLPHVPISRATICRLVNESAGVKSHAGNLEKAVPLTETNYWQAAA
jgi:hypothetical protein